MEYQSVPVLMGSGETVQLPQSIFGVPYNEALVHQVVQAYLAGGRQGTKAQKTRAEVRGGGAKPWKQKGSGRARAGTIRSPIWRKGGVTFAAKPRNFSQKVNKKMYRGAMASILAESLRSGVLRVVDSLSVDAPKTKSGLALLKALGIENKQRVLLIDAVVSESMWLSVRNLHWVFLLTPECLDPVTVLHADTILVTRAALAAWEQDAQYSDEDLGAEPVSEGESQ